VCQLYFLVLLASIPFGMVALFTAYLDILPKWFLPYVHFGTVVVVLALLFYLRLSPKMSIGIFIWCSFCLWGNVQLEFFEPFGLKLWQSSLVLFVVAWIGQFIGHKIEGEKPSFFEDIQFLLIGPAWLMGFIYKGLGIKF
jgi:uncharacterized membrane protein YGL010W